MIHATAACIGTMARPENSGQRGAPVPEKLCRAQLEKVTSSATFARAEQLQRLLAWLGTRSLEDESAPPTEKEIGGTVLRRRDFDPQADSLVRKEMSRLRLKLAQYYAKEGAVDRVRIRHLRGYTLRFEWSGQLGADYTHEIGCPCLLILPFRTHPDLAAQSILLAEELSVRLGKGSHVTLVSPTTALSYAGRIGDVREFAAECGADLVLEGSLDLASAQLRVTLWLVDGHTGKTVSPGRFTADDAEKVAQVAGAWFQEQILRIKTDRSH